jgi:MFS family permease
MGLMFPAMFTALNCYFDKRLSMVNSVAQAFMVAASMVFPLLVQHLMSNLGFRGTVAVISALSLNTVLAAVTLQPVKWHMKKQQMGVDKEELLVEEKNYVMPKPRTSIVSMGDRALSVTTLNKTDKSFWQSLVVSMDLGMFKDPVYLNISLGLALGFTADVAFISIILPHLPHKFSYIVVILNHLICFYLQTDEWCVHNRFL